MGRNLFINSGLIAFFLFLFCVLLLPVDVFAASADTANTTIRLSEEEQAYLERSDEIVIGCEGGQCPLTFRDEKTGQLEGITIDILNMISEITGLTFRYQELPVGNVTYKDLKRLKVDMVAGVELNSVNEHSLGIAMTDAYLHAEKVFVCKKGVVFHTDSEKRIAVASGSQTIEQVIKKQYPKFQVIFYDTIEEALSAVLSGKADAVLQNQYTMERILCKPIYEDLQIVATASIGDSQCLACIVPVQKGKEGNASGDSSLLLSIINKGISHLDKDKVSFYIIKETAENTYQFTMWDMMYRYRYAYAIVFISLLFILFLLRRNHILKLKHSEQLVAQQRAKELAAINARMKEQQLIIMDSLKHAEEGNRAKTDFLFNMSHDIRTPMNAILGFAQIAQNNLGDTDKLANCIEKIQMSGKHLLSLIDDVLDMAKIEHGKVVLTEDCCNLEECIEKAQSILESEIDEKHLIVQTDMSDVKNKCIYCDSIRLNQILFNVLINAVKFNRPGGSISIKVSQSMCDIREYATYEIRITDTGIGMTPEFLSHIFEPFERERTSTVSQTQGVGLGMSITKNLVDLMEGTIQVFSEPDEGTEFVLQFTFKLQQQEQLQSQSQPQQQPSNETIPANDFSGKRLLLVEDNEMNMEIAQELLGEAGFLVETAKNGQIAVDMVRNSTAGYYDAILMDIQMPVMDGYQASREIRSFENKDLAEIPIIALTANAFDRDKKEALLNGMNAHIAKPIDVDVLYKELYHILQ